MPLAKLTITVRNVRGISILDLKGYLTMGQPVELMRDTVHKLLNGGVRKMAINLTEIMDVESTGTGSLAAAFASCRKVGAKLKVFAAPERLLNDLAVTRLDAVLDHSPDEASCLKSFESS